jgi:peptide/nickel transport system ATP-binding protein
LSVNPLLSIQGLRVAFPTPNGKLLAVDNIDLSIEKSETVGLVGESGSGKTVTGRAILNLVPRPGWIQSGKVLYKGKNLLNMYPESLREIRGKEITAIQQDPLSALNPAFKVQDQMVDILKLHKNLDKKSAHKASVEILRDLGIDHPEQVIRKFPHQLSGGMAQRIMIGIAFSCGPSLVVADEPTTALDVITQAGVIELMKKFQRRFSTSVLFITHNLGLAAKVCDKIAVMYAGKIVEFARADDIFRNPSHPYTKNLLESVPKIKDESKRISSIPGAMPDLAHPPKGCRFYSRCSVRMPACQAEIKFDELGTAENPHLSLCLRAREVGEILA